MQESGLGRIVPNCNLRLERNPISRMDSFQLDKRINSTTTTTKGIATMIECISEETEDRILSRRTSILRELSQSWSSATDLRTLWTRISNSISSKPHEFPFAAIYSARSNFETGSLQNESEKDAEERSYYLEAAIGDFEDGALPFRFSHSSDSGSELQTRCLNRAVTSRTQVLVRERDGTFPHLWSKASLRGGCGGLCTEAVVFPSSLTKFQKVEALLVLGLGTRRHGNDDVAHQAFLHELQREFADAVYAIQATTEAACRRKENARHHLSEKEFLAKELVLRQKEAELAISQVKRVLDVIEQVGIGIFEYAATGELIMANSGYRQLSGYPNDAPRDAKHKFLDLIHPEERDLLKSKWATLMKGDAVRFETRYRNPAPEGQWVLVAGMPVRDESGTVTGIIGCVTDIAAQKRNEQEAITRIKALERAKASDERFYRFRQAAPVGIMIADVTKGIQYANDAWFSLSAHPRVPLDQIDWNSVIHVDDQELAEEKWQNMLQGEEVNYSLRLKRLWHDSDGQPRGPAWLMVRALPEYDAEGKVVQVLGITIDISHLKFAESVHKLRMEEAVEAKRQQENFIDMTSHEIRNPLSAVVHCADSIADSLTEMAKLADSLASKIKDPAVQDNEIKRLLQLIESSTESVDTISTCSDHQKRIVTDVLTLSKLDSKLLQITPLATRVKILLKNVGKMFQVEAERVGVKMKLITDKSVQELMVDWVQLDSGRILQVLINLITNAIKFTKSEAGPRTVEIVMGASKKLPHNLPVDFTLTHNVQDRVYESPKMENEGEFYLWFTVTDSGRGMTTEEKGRIFSRFAQGSPRTYNQYGGSGLGLFISRELVELQGGEIGVATEPGKGSTFAFFVKTSPADVSISHALPMAISCTPIKSSSHKGARIIVSEVDQPPLQQTRVLVVEDNVVNQRVLKKQLTKHGYIVHVANNGQEALDFLNLTSAQEPQVDVILMDIEMPVLNGISCARKIRELERMMNNNNNNNINRRSSSSSICITHRRNSSICSTSNHGRKSSICSSSDSILESPIEAQFSRPKNIRGDSLNSVFTLGSLASSDCSLIENTDNNFPHIPIIAISANARPEQTKEAILAGMDDAISKPFRVVDLTPRIDRLISWSRSRVF